MTAEGGIRMSRLMRNVLLIELAIAAIVGVLVALVWDGLQGDTGINPAITLGPGWLAGLIAGGIVFAGVAITALIMRKDLHDEHIDPGDSNAPDLHRLAAMVGDDDARDRPSRTTSSQKA